MSKEHRDDVYVSRDVRAAARAMLRRRNDFENHAAIYLIVNLSILLGTWLIWGTWTLWSLVLPGIWGVGLVFDAWFAFGRPNRPIIEEAIDREVTRLTGRHELPAEPAPSRHDAYGRALDTARGDRFDAGFDDHAQDITRGRPR
jgi:hypothetical protein